MCIISYKINKMKNKHLILSFVYLILAFTILFTGVTIFNDTVAEKFDWFVFSLSNYKWLYSSLTIEYFLSILLPLIFAVLSIFSGFKFLKQNPSKKLRIISIVILTFSIFSTFVVVVFNLFHF